ncbi:hypothetical protein H310_00307 [Aphanomyces invadans]|uniref:Peptidase S1 domain-containing protein n=1 Tax=Aphanomyces invadans TaxID=157072 RepID=A0A024UV95_9STRA|nr:hypothetical protein H310_00307 [Aphanomyces invadans]ETW09852.1 hypothetical protein H310_00307 [Aphanomyces invadans]|eukprot:XP_008861263.1 hypothetical protein H310_00307 [Aphanomyces invadans]
MTSRRGVLALTTLFRLPHEGMQAFEVLSRGSAMLVHRTGAKRNPTHVHVLTCAHVACPWRYSSYYPHDWLEHVDENFVKHTLALREVGSGATKWEVDLLPHTLVHPTRDLALLELQSSILTNDDSVDPFDLDTAFAVAENEPLEFHGHIQLNETAPILPESVAGAYFWLNPTTKQAFASSEKVLAQGMCGGAAFTKQGRKVVGLIEGIVPVVENASPAYKTLENHVAVIPRDDLADFVVNFEAGRATSDLLFTGTALYD